VKHAIHAIRTFLSDIRELMQHSKLNRIIDFIEGELPLIYEEMVKAQLEIEQLKERIKQLEDDRNG
jgi:aminopeptidase-like protein